MLTMCMIGFNYTNKFCIEMFNRAKIDVGMIYNNKSDDYQDEHNIK